ncbi:MAG: hypothetical protein KJ623_00895 [Nanoarchaeota archaeon]|nr:hypothetical protein [Nanoarchaeota archaeon]MBU0962803.1 hypothetical protein [Nanoarchaeota archaeon]
MKKKKIIKKKRNKNSKFIENPKFLVGSLGLIFLTITCFIFIWYGKDINAMGYFAIAFSFLASSSNIKNLKDLIP